MDLICAVQTESPFQFEFRPPKQCPIPLLTLEKASIAYGDKTIIQHLGMSLTPKDRIAVLGPNGAGKSSLIKLLAGEITAAQGNREASPGLKIGYFAQHQVDHLQLEDTPILHLQRLAESSTEQELRTYLGSFGFNGDNVFQPVKNFSGGEKSRLALALLIWQRPNLLLLDEPTNHLDLEMRNALSIALQEYEGAMILVSHDRFLVRSTTDQLLLVADGELSNFEGDLNDYQQWLIEFRKQQVMNNTRSDRTEQSRKEQRQQDAKRREMRRPLLNKIKMLEEQLKQLEKDLSNIEITLADLSLYEPENKNKLQTILIQQAKIKKEIELTEEAWLSACEERDKSENYE
jgi:ATP-binding cassette subfamily F protein 3